MELKSFDYDYEVNVRRFLNLDKTNKILGISCDLNTILSQFIWDMRVGSPYGNNYNVIIYFNELKSEKSEKSEKLFWSMISNKSYIQKNSSNSEDTSDEHSSHEEYSDDEPNKKQTPKKIKIKKYLLPGYNNSKLISNNDNDFINKRVFKNLSDLHSLKFCINNDRIGLLLDINKCSDDVLNSKLNKFTYYLFIQNSDILINNSKIKDRSIIICKNIASNINISKDNNFIIICLTGVYKKNEKIDKIELNLGKQRSFIYLNQMYKKFNAVHHDLIKNIDGYVLNYHVIPKNIFYDYFYIERLFEDLMLSEINHYSKKNLIKNIINYLGKIIEEFAKIENRVNFSATVICHFRKYKYYSKMNMIKKYKNIIINIINIRESKTNFLIKNKKSNSCLFMTRHSYNIGFGCSNRKFVNKEIATLPEIIKFDESYIFPTVVIIKLEDIFKLSINKNAHTRI